MKLKDFFGGLRQKWRWLRWRRAVIREATADFSEILPADKARRDAREWVEASETALRWWFNDGATPPEAFLAVSEENDDG